jgi:basic membrane protein A
MGAGRAVALVVAVGGVGLGGPSACSSARSSAGAADAGAEAQPAPGRACLVADTSGLDDQSFNQTAYEGERQAATQFGWTAYAVESHSSGDYSLLLHAYMSSERCDLIIAVGALMTDATTLAADQALSAPVGPVAQRFVLLDSSPVSTRANVWGQTYAIHEAAFLAGYVAAAVTTTGVVATFGGVSIPPVTDYMDGYVLGVRAYEQAHARTVQVLGWDPDTKSGTFIGNFVDQEAGRRAASAQIQAGADVVMPVAGGAGLGAGEALLQAGKGYLIGVDSDWTKSAPQYKAIVLTSVLKRLDLSVVDAVRAVVQGMFAGGSHVADLKSGEIDLAPFLSGKVDDKLSAELASLRAGIISGTVPTKP